MARPIDRAGKNSRTAELSRREFLRLGGRAALTLPFWFAGSGCVTARNAAADSRTGLSFGCVAGDVTSDSALVWLRAEPGSRVSLRYGTTRTLERFLETALTQVERNCDDTAKIPLAELKPATTYYYRAVVNGKKPGPVARFRTAPAPGDLAPVQFCFSGDSRENYQPFTIMDSIRAMEPDFFLHLGDTIYADIGGRATQLDEFWAKYRNNRYDLPSQKLFRETSAYVIWDDHEVANNCDSKHPLMEVGRKAFMDYWPVRRDPRHPHRLYRSFRWGAGVELFILDLRQYRDRTRHTMLGAEQKRWLFDALASSTAVFKFVASSVPFYGDGRDRWDGFPAERDELLRWIGSQKITGVVFLSADVHYAAVSRIPGAPGGMKEIIAGPIASPMNVINGGTAKRYEFFSNATFNFAMITVDPRQRTPHALVEFFDDERNSMYRTRLEAV